MIIIIKAAYLAAIILSMFTSGWLLIRANRNRLSAALVGCQLLIIIWCIPQVFMSLVATRGIKYLLYDISYIGISFIGPTWLIFVMLYQKKELGRFTKAALYGVAAVNYLLLLTNEWHHLFYRSFELEQVIYGPVFYIHMAYTYLCVLAGIVVLLAAFKRNRVASRHIVIILLAAAIPLAFNMFYMTGLIPASFDLTPPAFAFSSIFMLLAVFRYDFLDVNTMAFGKIFDSISEGVVVYNKREKITYCNQTASSWFAVQTGDSIDEITALLTVKGVVPINDAGQNNEPGAAVLAITVQGEELQLEVKDYTYYDKNGQVFAHALMFTDVARYYQLLAQRAELAVSNQRLAIEQERNRIAQEVHDTAGHTLTMINSLMKLSRIEYEKQMKHSGGADWRGESDPVPEYLKQAQEMAENGIRELRCSINDLRQAAEGSLITQRVYQLARSVKEIQVDVKIQGEDKLEYSHLSPVVYECIREAITNCLKYAGATGMDIILKFTGSVLQLYIFDNGCGCNTIKEGNGIRGIRERVEKAGGEARVISEAGEGFQISIRLPYQTGV